MNRQLIGDESGLVGYWNFDRKEGTVVEDKSENGNHGTIYGASQTLGLAETATSFDPIESVDFNQIESYIDQTTKYIDESAESLHPLLIERLDQEINENIQEIPIQIELEEQEEFIETTLSEYIEAQYSEINENSIENENSITRPEGKALFFDGNNDSVKIDNHPSLNPTQITIEAWVKSSNWSDQQHPAIVAKGINQEYLLWKSDDAIGDEKFAL